MDELKDLYDEDLNLGDPVDNTEIPVEITPEDENFFDETPIAPVIEDTLLNELLKARGIENGKITIINEDNTEEEVNFTSLSKEEQLEILNDFSPEESLDLDDAEINLINSLREKNWTVEQFLEDYKQSVINSLSESSEPNYDIDAYDDQELFLLDLKNKYNLTDEELVKELDKQLQDETIFKKKVDILRAEYKQLEDQYQETQRLEFAQKEQEKYDQFTESMVNIAVATPEFYGIELEDDEKNEVLSFLLDLDEQGASAFSKTLNDPKKLYEAAWFLRYGKESFDALKNAYESEINKLKKDSKPTVVHQNSTHKSKSIHDLF